MRVKSTPRFRSAAIALAITLAMTPALSGCFANPIESIVEGATGGNVDVGSSVPEGFPTEVPLVDGEVQYGAAAADGDAKVFNVTTRVSGASPVEGIRAELEGAGFAAQTEFTGDAAEGGTLIYASDAWGVLVVVAQEGDDWVVNYTVTTAEPQ